MHVLQIVLLVVFLGGAAIGIYAWKAPRREPEAVRAPGGEPLQATTAWTSEAGEEFSGLSEAARCDLLFAVGALDDERSKQLLEHALDDPSEAVATAAAHTLASTGRRAVLERYVAAFPGERAERIMRAVTLLDPL